jgi:outer membrane protein OmpA-like peptidoglycan-associated protein
MSALTILSDPELASIGLSKDDRTKFIETRVRFGVLDSAQAIDRVTKKLSPKGAKAFKGYVKAQGMVAAAPTNSLNILRLILVPSPPMLSQPGLKAVVGFRLQTEQVDYEVHLDFTMGGINEIKLHDVSFDHLIVYRVLTASDDLLVERVLSPASEQHGDLTAKTWTAVPPIGPNESLQATASALDARLVIDTVRPAANATTKPAPASPVFERKGRFVVIGQPDFGFGGYSLSVGLATPNLLTAIAASLDTSGGNVAAQARFTPGDARFNNLAAALPLVAGELDYSGAFHTLQETQTLDMVTGWIWVLTGPDTVVGFRPDPAPSGSAPEALIFLPANLAPQPNQGGLPQNVSEATLLARPDLFSDDPGSDCKPFSNPGRILGEKRFRTVLRVTQPQVARAGLTPIRYEGQDQRKIDFPRVDVDPGNPVDYETDPSRFQAQSVALGHILEHVVRYRSNGYSLGNIAHSLTLAPREKRRIMTVDFTRNELASRTEGTSAGDEVMDNLDSQRDYYNAVSGELNEWSRGSSESSAVGAAGGAGGIIPGAPVVMGGGLSGGASQSSATQSSHRGTAAREGQRLRDAIRRYGQSLRNLESTVVTEVSQSETVTGVSEVVQNINYTRALTIVYYEILRHLRVDTEVDAVSECVFVPMPVRPFSDARISRHRKTLAHFARGWLERSVFRYLDDIQADFAGSEIPRGVQWDQPLTRLSGSLTMTMGINMPVNGAPRRPATTDSDAQLVQTSTAFEDAWQPFANLLPMPVSALTQMLVRSEAEKLFRTQIAPAMARAFVEHLTLGSSSRQVEPIDFTPVSAYKRGQPFQVDFDVIVDGTLTRRDLETLTLRIDSEFRLPPGSYLNLSGATISYSTKHYEGRASQQGGKRDLLDTHTGTPDASGAALSFPPSSDDLLNLQERLKQGYDELKKTLEANTFRYHKAIWMGIDADELYALLDGYAIPGTDGLSLASVIERRPLGILGNSLVFATRTDWPLDPLYRSFAELKAHYVSGLPPADPIRVSLPTSGLYARAHMDDCIAAEEHDGSFDWVFNNTEPDLADFPSGMFDSRRSEPQGLTPTAFPDTIINLQNAPAAPAPTGLASTLTTLGTDAFRDITGLAGTQQNLQAAMSNATNLASTAMTQAVAAQAAQLASDAQAGKELNAFAAAVKKAVDSGQMTPDSGNKIVKDMAERLANGGGGQGGGGDDLHKQVLTGDAEATHSSVDKDGTTKTTTKKPAPQRRPEPSTDVFVVPFPDKDNPQVLFLNFATGKSELRPGHVQYLETLAAIVGVTIEDVVNMEGHASISGSEETNRELGANRALNLFNRLHRLVTPLGADPDYSPAQVTTTGEIGSYRTRFAHDDRIAKIPGKGDPNDPVEKAVLFTLKAGVDLTLKSRPYDCGGTEVTVINNYLWFGSKIYCSLPNGPVKEIDRGTLELLNDNVVNTDVYTGDNTIGVDAGSGNQFSLFSFNGEVNIFGRDPATGVFGEPTKTPPIAEQPHNSWKIKLFEPEIDNPTSMDHLLKKVAGFAFDIVSSGLSLPSGAPQMLMDIVAEAGTVHGNASIDDNDKLSVLYEFLLTKFGLAPVKTLLEMMLFGPITMRGQITIEDEENKADAMVEGSFSAPGFVIGTTGPTSPDAVILNNADYKTSKELSLVAWERQHFFAQFSYIDDSPSSALVAGSLAAGHLVRVLTDLVTNVMPDIVKTLANRAARDLADQFVDHLKLFQNLALKEALLFRVFDDDVPDQINASSVSATGANFRMFTMTPGKIAFTRTKAT